MTSTTASGAPLDFLPGSILAGLGAVAVGVALIERRRRKQRQTEDRGADMNGGEIEKK